MKTIQTAACCLFLGVFLLPAAPTHAQFAPAQSPPETASARVRLEALSQALRAPPVDPADLPEWTNAKLYLRKARFLLSAYSNAFDLGTFVARELQKAEDSLSLINAAEPAPWIAGFREEGYYCDNDASFQPFVRYVPRSARPGKKLPLLIFLHGYNPDLNIVNWQSIPYGIMWFAEQEGFYAAAPFGRSNTDYQGIGEQDVLSVIAEMVKRYAVDEDRIILSGHSMGGTGVWMIGARHPELFAGLFTVSGRGDYYSWHNVSRGELPAYKQRMIDADFAGSLVRNLRTIPIYCAHGAKDDIVPVEQARVMADAVGRINPRLTYVELEEEGHGIWDLVFARTDAQDWLRGCRRTPDRAGEPAVRPGYGRKSGSGVCGPVKEAFLSPFLFVLAGDPEDPGQSALFKQGLFDWYRFARAVPRVAAEPDVNAEALRTHNIFLFGEPENSALIRRALAVSPVTVTARSFRVGSRSFPRKGNGLYLVRPSPWNPEKRVVVQCGLPWGRGLAENHKYDLLPDYIVYTAASDGDGSNTALDAGFFTENGQVED